MFQKPGTGGGLAVVASWRSSPLVVQAIVFMILAFAATWAAESVVLLSNQAAVLGGEQHRPALSLPIGGALTFLLVGDIGPALAALVTVAMFNGRRGVRKLLGQFGRWRIAWYWYPHSAVCYGLFWNNRGQCARIQGWPGMKPSSPWEPHAPRP